MTPWAPIAITLIATLGAASLVWRFTHNAALAISTALLVLAIASFALGTIATIAFFWGGFLLIGALAGFLAAWLRRGPRPRRSIT